jgi:hypothetical protein
MLALPDAERAAGAACPLKKERDTPAAMVKQILQMLRAGVEEGQ